MSSGRGADVDLALQLAHLPKVSAKINDRNVATILRKSMHLQPPPLSTSNEFNPKTSNFLRHNSANLTAKSFMTQP
jgi:hypothetical protein